MALLQIRRGNSAAKGVLAYGEPYYNCELGTVEWGGCNGTEIMLLTTTNASVIGSKGYKHTQNTSATTWSFTHSLNDEYPVVTAYDGDREIIIPGRIIPSGPNAMDVYFDVPVRGVLSLVSTFTSSMTTGGLGPASTAIYATTAGTSSWSINSLTASYFAGNLPTGSTYKWYQTQSAAMIWSFTHSLSEKYPVVTVYNELDEVIIPTKIVASSPDTMDIYFNMPVSGVAALNTGLGFGTYVGGQLPASTYKYYQTESAYVWRVTHSISESYPVVTVYDDTDGTSDVIIPTRINITSPDTLDVYFDQPVTGTLAIGTGTETAKNAISAAYAFYSTTASYALTASYVLGGVMGATRKWYQTASAATTWSFTHSLNEQYPVITVYDMNNNVIIPGRINVTSPDTLDVYFDLAPKMGVISVTSGGGGGGTVSSSSISASYAFYSTTASYALTASHIENLGYGDTWKHFQYVPLATWSFSHFLGEQWPNVTVYDLSNTVIQPGEIVGIDVNSMEVKFKSPQTGIAVLSVGGLAISSSVTSSYALTASYLLGAIESASYAATASYFGGVRAGTLTPADFGGLPFSASVVFSSPFPSTAYSIAVIGEDGRYFTVITGTKTAAGFELSTNSNTPIVGNVDWTATQHA
jgi:hypothetical protein